MDSIGPRNWMRHSSGPVALCLLALCSAVAAAELPDTLAPAATSVQHLFLPPVLTAAAIDPDAPAVYRLPPVAEPAEWLSEADSESSSEIAVGDASRSVSVDDDRLAANASVQTGLARRSYGLEGVTPSVDIPLPDDADTDADAPVADTDATAPSEHSLIHRNTGQPGAADNHPTDVDAGGGSDVEPDPKTGVLPYTPTAVELTTQLLPAVQHACSLAERGATFAARAEFIQVLRRIAQVLDARSDGDEHAIALAAGLRALDEADDFSPRGTQLEAELDVAMMASSHRTPVLAGGTAGVTPREAAALYLSYAQQQLGQAVAEQQAGSMALHALGRLYGRLAQGADGDARYVRKAMTLYMAALEACPQNHLAANELGVLLAHNGHYGEAETMFRRAVSISPTATGYHNLAVVQQRLGRPQEAIANQQQADRLAAWERANGQVSQRKGIQWVTPDVLAHAGQETLVVRESLNPSAMGGAPGSTPVGGTLSEPATATVPAAQSPFTPPPLETSVSHPTSMRIARPGFGPGQNTVQ